MGRLQPPTLHSGVLDALFAARVVLAETRGGRGVVLNLEQAEVERVLGEMGGQQWRNMLVVEWKERSTGNNLLGFLSYSL
jgi:origin recognition complex subunit 1